MLKSIEGIVTRTTRYGETSVILDLLSPEQGLQSFIISGVRKKSGKKKSAMVRVLNIVKAEAYVKDNDRLSRIKEISYAHIYQSIPFDIVKSTIATFIIEVCRKTVKASDDYSEVYHYIIKGLIHLDNTSEGLAHFHIGFLLGLTKHLGIAIQNNYTPTSPYFNMKDGTFEASRSDHRYTLSSETSYHLAQYNTNTSYQGANRTERQEIIKGIVDFYQYHIEGFGELKSLDILFTLFSD